MATPILELQSLSEYLRMFSLLCDRVPSPVEMTMTFTGKKSILASDGYHEDNPWADEGDTLKAYCTAPELGLRHMWHDWSEVLYSAQKSMQDELDEGNPFRKGLLAEFWLLPRGCKAIKLTITVL